MSLKVIDEELDSLRWINPETIARVEEAFAPLRAAVQELQASDAHEVACKDSLNPSDLVRAKVRRTIAERAAVQLLRSWGDP